MICRIWSARANDNASADAYQHIFSTDVLAELRSVDGLLGAYLLRRDLEDSGTEFVTLTMFDSYDAVRAFAGEHYYQAHVTGPAGEVLSDFDRRVRHFSVAVSA